MSDDEFLAFLAARRRGDNGMVVESRRPRRCGLDVTFEAARRLRTMTSDRRATLRALMQPPRTQDAVPSPSGRFLIHYDTLGGDAAALLDADEKRIPGTAALYAREVGRFFDSAYTVEVTELGYAPPPFEAGRSAYDVYIKNSGDYGVTEWLTEIPAATRRGLWTSHIIIDNDFSAGFETRGLNGARVTAAHEFHHMVQFGSYGLCDDDRYFHEMTSTWCEQVVFPGIPDYYQYLDDFLGRPERSFVRDDGDGYPLLLLPMLIEKRIDRSVLRLAWENIRQTEPVTSLDAALRAQHPPSDLGAEYCALARWSYFTGARTTQTASGEKFEHAADYPLARIASDLPIAGKVAFAGVLPPLAVMYFRVSSGGDAVAFAVTNTDVSSASRKSMSGTAFSLQAGPDVTGSGVVPVGNGWSYRFTASSPIFCVSVLGVLRESSPVSPNPYHPERDGVIRFGVPKSIVAAKVTLTIFTAGMSRVIRFGDEPVASDAVFGRFVAWNGVGEDGNPASTGVYFFTLDAGGAVEIGKFVIVRK